MVLSQPSDQHVLKSFSLEGKVVAITGGARGIGLEVSRAVAEAGGHVAIIYSSSKDAPVIAEDISKANNITAKAYQSEVKDATKIEQTIQQIAQDFGKLDCIIANAGITSHHAAEEYSVQEWRDIMDVNLDGAFYTAQAAGRIFKKQGFGNVIFTASVSAILVNVPQKQAAYNASKAAVVQLARCLAVEWVDFARVNCISPGFIETDMLQTHPKESRKTWYSMVPAGRFCQPYELKGSYIFLASDSSSYMTGANLVIDGAYTLP